MPVFTQFNMVVDLDSEFLALFEGISLYWQGFESWFFNLLKESTSGYV